MQLSDAIETVFEEFTDPDLVGEILAEVDYPEATLDLVQRFARELTNGVWKSRVSLDRMISIAIPDYDYNRLALIDKNIMRVAVYEFENIDYVPPAVTINEAIEISKKYSTGESGKFINGVLAKVLKSTKKAEYSQKNAPKDPDFEELERIYRAPAPQLIEETIEEDSETGKIVSRYGIWTNRGE